MRMRQHGATGLMILVILVLIAVALLAMAFVNRIGSGKNDLDTTIASLNRAAAALDAYAGTTGRLPCPADPTVDTGLELTSGAANCSKPTGTLPWATIGIRRDDAYDAWGRKIFYRVSLSNAGSLVQAGGIDMTNCDTVEASPAGPTASAGNPATGGLCRTTNDTTPDQFVAGKGLTVTDFGVVHNDVAYVLISTGLTGLGGYGAAGTRLINNAGGSDEQKNLNAAGPFTIEAFSNTDTGANTNNFFDDVLVYRTIGDLAKRANRAARDWPDSIITSQLFDKNSLQNALGSNPGSDTGQQTINFGNVSVTAFDSGGNQDISFTHGGGHDDAIGVVGGTGLVTSGGDGLRIDFAADGRQLAFTLDRFNSVGSPATSKEQVEVRFFEVVNNTATLVGSPVTKQSCSNSGNDASFTVDAGVSFNRVELRPLQSTSLGISDFTLAEVRTCAVAVTCQTTIDQAGTGDRCP